MTVETEVTAPEINRPEVVAELTDLFHRYEAALLASDTVVLDAMFLEGPETLRYGVADTQYGSDALRAYRAGQAPFTRTLMETRITTYGTDYGIASTLFIRDDLPDEIGRQMQTWLRTPEGWRIVAAHVSSVPAARMTDR
ncbi:oxalurate catabolism protein HpxZ [Acidimangrovimonas sediminis]|uniref:oxalurate catabolism protein HpxZ n=1 Tax=Acidimangrovimonas sediminis TaxID=2056283 RepID=UPI000C80DA99|nr:oxalurate catabolism protein HpxZ [Acidimangrovimonas sediminis]